MNHSLQETLLKNILFAYNEAIELVISMGMLACEDQISDLAEDYKIEADELLGAYLDDARKRLSHFFTRELLFFSVMTCFIMHLISRCMNPSSLIGKC